MPGRMSDVTITLCTYMYLIMFEKLTKNLHLLVSLSLRLKTNYVTRARVMNILDKGDRDREMRDKR